MACKKPDASPTNPTTTNPPTTNNKPPILITNNVSNLTYFSVTLNGKLIDSGSSKINEIGIVVDTVSKATVGKNLNKFLTKLLNTDNTFGIDVNALPSNVTFYVRAYGINATDTSYGNEIKFTSLTQKIYQGDLNLTSQQQVIDFGTNHYTTINGALNISGTVSDLSPLLGLAIVNNGFNTNRSLLTNFRGLDSLEVTGAIFPNDFWVEWNQYLINFSGLSKLKMTRGSVQIDNNISLTSLDGLDRYEIASAGGLIIGGCPKLQNINGLKSLTAVGQDLVLTNNYSLTDISGLAKLSTISGRLYVINNTSLQNLNGLGQIKSIPDGLEITSNMLLEDLSGLSNLNLINGTSGIGSITVNGNPKIADLSVFNKITSVDYVRIINNKSLKNLTGFSNLQNVSKIMQIENDSSLTDLSGLEKLNSVGTLNVIGNINILNLKGLNGLTELTQNGLGIGNNNNLSSLAGLENLSIIKKGTISITGNPVLTDFCSLKTLFNKGFNQTFYTEFNALNPTQAYVIANCH